MLYKMKKIFLTLFSLTLVFGAAQTYAAGIDITENLHVTLTEGIYTIRGAINVEDLGVLPQPVEPLSIVLFGDDSVTLSEPYVHTYVVHNINSSIDSDGNYDINMSVGTSDPSGLYYHVALVDDNTLSTFGGSFNPYTQTAQFSVMWFDSNEGIVNVVPITDEEAGGGPVVSNPSGDPCPDPTSAECVPEGDGYNPNFVLTTTIANPLGVDFNIVEFLRKLFTNFVKIALPFLVMFMVYSGFLFVEARGNEEKLSKAKKNFFYVIIGATLIFGAWMIALVLRGTVDQFEQAMAIIKLLA